MPFIGTQPEVGGYSVLDALTASATASYTLQKDSANFSPSSANHLLVSLNGVIQKPGSSFTVSGSTLTFSSALDSSDSIDFILAMGEPLLVGTPSDGTVNADKLATNAVSTAKIANDAVTGAKIENNPTIAGNLTVSGTSTLTGNVGVNSGTGGQVAVNYSTASTTGLKLNDTNSGNLGGFIDFRSGSGTGTQRATIQNANNAGIHVNVGTGGSLSFGTGYTAANALDDYEEGTSSPALGSAGSPSYGHQYGRYTKVGRIVHLFVTIHATNISGSGTIAITGLPFAGTQNADSQQRHSILVANSGHLSGLSDDTARFRISGSTLTGVKGNSSTTYLQAGQLTSSGTIQFSGQITYFIA